MWPPPFTTTAGTVRCGTEDKKSIRILSGDIVYAESPEKLTVLEQHYLIVRHGLVETICSVVPEEYKGIEVEEYVRNLIIPAFSDLHVHASQYAQRGVGMDLLLSDWLNQYTFPQEAKFADPDYAKQNYDAFVEDLIRHGTFHVNAFATIHRQAADYLFGRLEEKGLYAYVGKVNMDCHSPSYLIETTNKSLKETEKFLDEHQQAAGHVRSIIVPRFAPTCSEALLKGLGKLAARYQVGVHTHLVESKWEAAEALRLFPGYHSDAEIYERNGLMDNGPSVFAHVIFPTDEDIRILKKHRSIAVHCPDATANIIAGIMPLASMADSGIRIAAGSDIAGGHGIAVYRQIARAVQLSKLKELYEPEVGRTITLARAFYHATKEGGSLFGKVGSFEEGYHFNALVIRNMEDPWRRLSPGEQLERFCYTGDDRDILARYLDGEKIECP